MQRLVMSKPMTTIALFAGAAALSVFGSSSAGAAPGHPGPVTPAGQSASHMTSQGQSAGQSGAQAGTQTGNQSGTQSTQQVTGQAGNQANGQAGSQAAAQSGAQSAAQAAASVKGKVVSTVPLRIRASATTNSADLGSYAPGAVINLKCKVNGQTVDGNPRWYKLADRTGWVAARYVQNLAAVPWC